ncbi:hypothetical protein PV326_011087 [Microctonus aethiopoides]|nr:hypothetical protein PV326_011087 [Microctonus aethiopoides]
MRRTGNGLKLDLTENTPDSSSSRLPNLVEHAESYSQGFAGGTGEHLNSKLPNVVEGSMDYGSERRSSRYLDYEPKNFQDGQIGGSYIENGIGGVGTKGDDNNYGDRSYSTRNFERKLPSDGRERDTMERYDNRIYPEDNSRFDGRTDRPYQESDLDVYDSSETQKLRNYNPESQDNGRRYSRDLTDYEYTSRYAEETLKLESKTDHRHHIGKMYDTGGKMYNTLGKGGYESGIKTRESSYELGTCSNVEIGGRTKYESKYNPTGKMYGTLPRYESSNKVYDTYDNSGRSYDMKYDSESYNPAVKGFQSSTSKYELSTSKSYIHDRSKYEPVARYQDTLTKSYDQTLKIGEVSTTSNTYQRKQNTETTNATVSEKTNGYRKNNFEAFGVYSDPEDDHGFLADKKTPQYTYKGVVVNATGESSVVDQKRTKEAQQTEVPPSPWCRPTILFPNIAVIQLFTAVPASQHRTMTQQKNRRVTEKMNESEEVASMSVARAGDTVRQRCGGQDNTRRVKRIPRRRMFGRILVDPSLRHLK